MSSYVHLYEGALPGMTIIMKVSYFPLPLLQIILTYFLVLLVCVDFFDVAV